MTLKVNIEDLPTNTRTPILTHCRKLLSQGADPDSEVWFFRQNRPFPDVLIKHLGTAAKYTVREDRQVGPLFDIFRKRYQDSPPEK